MKSLMQFFLKILARLTLLRYKPKIIGITGSVGKTSAKQAIAAVLTKRFSLRSSFENYNNEIGLPLTILNARSPGRNPWLWLGLILKAKLNLLAGKYPQVLVLEMGADRPGDIDYLTGIVEKLDAAVITDIGVSHLEFFASPQALAREKLSILKALSRNGAAVLNIDSQPVAAAVNRIKTRVIGYGFDTNASVRASDLQIVKKDDEWGINFKVHYRGTVVPFFLPGVLGRPAVYASLAAVAVGAYFGMNLVEIAEAVQDFSSLPGRLRLLKGIKRTLILDDTYNAAPNSTVAALEALNRLSGTRKLAAIGEMTELGEAAEEGHRVVAYKIMEFGIRAVFLVGNNTKIIAEELRRRHFSGAIKWFETSDQARIPVQNFLLEGDTILVKGSQATRMEKIVKEIMAEPMRARELLVRQTKTWLNK